MGVEWVCLDLSLTSGSPEGSRVLEGSVLGTVFGKPLVSHPSDQKSKGKKRLRNPLNRMVCLGFSCFTQVTAGGGGHCSARSGPPRG